VSFASGRKLLISGSTFIEHERPIVAVVADVNLEGVFPLIKQPSGWILLVTLGLIVADDDFEVCHCRISFLFHSSGERLGSDGDPTRADAVLAQNAVGDVFQLDHDSKPGALAPFNDIRLAVHGLTSFSICTAEPAQHKSKNSANPQWGVI
jgi:hypothetical protein